MLCVRSLLVRTPASAPRNAGAPRNASADLRNSLFRIEWTSIPVSPAVPTVAGRAMLGGDPLPGMLAYPDLTALRRAVASGTPVPDVALFPVTGDGADAAGFDADVTAATRAVLHRTLEVLQEWSAEELFGASRLVLLTSGAVAVRAWRRHHRSARRRGPSCPWRS